MSERKTTPSFRKALIARYGTKCHICGADGAEYHHIIPLWMGGSDEIGNFIPLCREHHLMTHGSHFRGWKTSHHGRRRSVAIVDGYKYILDDYIKCRIGTKDCKEALGLTKGTGLSDRVWFREYMNECGIAAHRNNIDIIKKKMENTGRRRKDVVGWVEYTDGRRKEFYWSDMKEYDA